jgi:Uma2 family endonuclease
MHSLAEQAVIEHYTREDHQRWEGDWELIQGIPLAMAPSPGIAHQRVSGRLYAQLAAALDGCPDCEVLFEIDVELAQDTIVRPDVIVICHRPEGDRVTRPPELIAEVISPSTRRRDEQTKFEL